MRHYHLEINVSNGKTETEEQYGTSHEGLVSLDLLTTTSSNLCLFSPLTASSSPSRCFLLLLWVSIWQSARSFMAGSCSQRCFKISSVDSFSSGLVFSTTVTVKLVQFHWGLLQNVNHILQVDDTRVAHRLEDSNFVQHCHWFDLLGAHGKIASQSLLNEDNIPCR